MILDKTVKIIPKSSAVKYYRNLGYKFDKNEEIEVDINDIPKHSGIKICVLCDFCKKNTMMVQMSNYTAIMEKSGSYVCKECAQLKKKITFDSHYGKGHENEYIALTERKKQTCLERYGVENPFQSKEIQDKAKRTNLERYGCENVFSNEEVKEKIKQTYLQDYGVESVGQVDEYRLKREQTCLEKYGVTNPAKNKNIQAKAKNTCIERYGVDCTTKSDKIKSKIQNTLIERYGTKNIMELPSVKNKIKQTNIERYGVDNPMKCPEIREKLTKTLCNNKTHKTSQQQIYLHNIFGGEINYPISYYATDLCLLDDKIVIEYDGGGHDLRVVLGALTQEEFDKKEIARFYVIKRAGYKQIRIISSKDKLPSDNILLKMLDEARNYFSTTSHTWVEYDIDTSTMRNAKNKDGVYYDFGELRRIKKVS